MEILTFWIDQVVWQVRTLSALPQSSEKINFVANLPVELPVCLQSWTRLNFAGMLVVKTGESFQYSCSLCQSYILCSTGGNIAGMSVRLIASCVWGTDLRKRQKLSLEYWQHMISRLSLKKWIKKVVLIHFVCWIFDWFFPQL